MNAEILLSLCIAAASISPVIILGIVQYNSKRPVSFWAGKEPPKPEEITDIKAYNHRHGIMWICYGAGFLLCFGLGFLFGEAAGIAASVLSAVELFGGLIGMILYHNRLDRIYLDR